MIIKLACVYEPKRRLLAREYGAVRPHRGETPGV